jgi:flagellar motility protein MotE (MotC chaperone)
MTHIPTPRLLPLTIFVLGGLLAVKSVTLVRAAVGSTGQSTPGATTAATTGGSVPSVASDNRAAILPPTAPVAPAAQSGAQSGLSSGPSPTLPSGPPPSAATTASVTDGERTVLLQLRQRRQELDARDTTVTARESTLAAAELRLNARVAELETLQHSLEGLEQAREQRDDASWLGLVKLYESMKPRDAATIFNDLDMKVLLGVVDRMKEAKAAPVLAAMQPDKAREVTTKLAALRTKRAAVSQSN